MPFQAGWQCEHRALPGIIAPAAIATWGPRRLEVIRTSEQSKPVLEEKSLQYSTIIFQATSSGFAAPEAPLPFLRLFTHGLEDGDSGDCWMSAELNVGPKSFSKRVAASTVEAVASVSAAATLVSVSGASVSTAASVAPSAGPSAGPSVGPSVGCGLSGSKSSKKPKPASRMSWFCSSKLSGTYPRRSFPQKTFWTNSRRIYRWSLCKSNYEDDCQLWPVNRIEKRLQTEISNCNCSVTTSNIHAWTINKKREKILDVS